MDVNTSVKTIGASSGVVYSIADQDIRMIFIVGLIGALAFLGKEYDKINFGKDQILNTILEIPFNFAMSFAMTVGIFFLGRDGFNPHIADIGVYLWIAVAFMCGMNYKKVLIFIGEKFDNFLDFLVRSKK